jgi:hypothetical protein
MQPLLFRLGLALSLWLCVAIGIAQEPKRVAVLSFEGAHADQIRAHAVGALSKQSGVEIVPEREVTSSAQRLGVTLTDSEAYQRVAADLGLSAFIEGKVHSAKSNAKATITVRNGANGEVLHEETWSRKTRAQLKVIRSNFWDAMGFHINASSAPEKKEEKAPEPAPVPDAAKAEPEPTQPESVPEAEDEPAAATGGRALIVSLGPRTMWRSLAYDETVDVGGRSLSTYNNEASSPAVNAALAARFYPGALFADHWAANIGLDATFDYAIGLKSKEGNKERTTTAYDLSGGLHYRIPIDVFEPILSVGYVRQVFDVQAAASTALPAITYSAARFGVATWIWIVERVAIDVHFDYLFLLGADDLTGKTYFPDASGFGFDAGAGLYVTVAGAFGLRLSADFRRYSFELNPPSGFAPSGGKIAETATDDYLRSGLSLVYTLDGKASAGSAPSNGQ